MSFDERARTWDDDPIKTERAAAFGENHCRAGTTEA